MTEYVNYDILKREFVDSVGYAGKMEIPAALVRKVAEFINANPDDSMTTYDVKSLFDQFYRKRRKERSIRLFDLLKSFLENKSSLIELFLRPAERKHYRIRLEDIDVATIWSAIRDLDDDYDKANCIGDYAYLFTDEIAGLAYLSALSMPDRTKTRALAGIYPRMDKRRKAEIFDYLLQQFSAGSGEAAYQIKFIFPYLDRASRTQAVSAHLDLPDVPEGFIAFLVIRNANYFEYDDAVRLAARARLFEWGYYKSRCLLKLAAYLHEGEIEKLYEQFMVAFNTWPASSALIHNLYHFSSVIRTQDVDDVISLALEKIACLSDPENFERAKYSEMMFVMPLLAEVHRERAFGIAKSVRGRYGQAIESKLRAHFANSKDFCEIRYSPIFY